MSKYAVLGFLCGTFCTSGMIYLSQVEYDHVRFPQNSLKFSSFRQEKKYNSMSLLKHGIPHGGVPVVLNPDFLLVYDQSKRIPLWVGEHITSKQLTGSAKRAKCRFTHDDRVDKRFQSQNEDYRRSGYSRGHMAAAGNYKHSADSMSDTFYLTNILPQDHGNNTGYWNRMEMHVRDLVEQYGAASVYSGPVFTPAVEADGKKYVRYQVIGENEVAVPTHLFKVIVVHRTDDYPLMGAFIVPNKKIDTQPLNNFQVPLQSLESRVGLHFLQKLKDYDDLCAEGGCQLMSDEKFHLYISDRNIRSANSLQDLERNWKRLLVQDKVTPSEEILSIYRQRLQELSEKQERQQQEKRAELGNA